MVVAPQFWQGKRVFLTGHTGFKGGWLALWLQQLGAQVTGFGSEAPTSPNMFEAARVAEGMTSIRGDIRSFDSLRSAMAECKPDVVFHLAAQALVRYSYTHPRETYETNVMGTVNLLDSVRLVGGVRAVVIVTSDKCYENKEWPWGYREIDRLGGRDPYSNSKGCAELVTASFRDSFFSPAEYSKHGVAIASVRAGNVIGGGDYSGDRLIPDFVRAIEQKQALRIRNPNAIRPWQHVLEALGGYLLLAERLCKEGSEFSGAWNFGPPDDGARPVSWIVERLKEHWETMTWEVDAGPHPHEATYLKLDCSRTRALLGWKPRFELETALGWLADWYKAARAGENMREFTQNQIRRYAQG